MRMEKTDITIIGAGVVGLAVASELAGNSFNILLVEKNHSFGQETSSRNSEVIHAGIYYPKNSLKAQTCIEGKELLYGFCVKNKVSHKKIGKLMQDLSPDMAGVRPKLQGRLEKFRDFIIKDETPNNFPGLINLIGIESPGLTSSLSIAKMVKKIIMIKKILRP